jgi:hypothetical protein
MLRGRPDPATAPRQPAPGHPGPDGQPQVWGRHDVHDPAEEPEQRSSPEWHQAGSLPAGQQRGPDFGRAGKLQGNFWLCQYIIYR